MTQATPNLSTYQLLQLKRKELERIKKQRELESILPHLYVPMYAWQRKIHESTNRVNLLTAANQIGKSSSLIRRAVANCTDQKRWERMWGKNVKPRQFWYFYPDGATLEKEIETKWVPDWLPRGPMERDAQYGWKLTKKSSNYNALHFNAGPIIYFQMYTKSVSNVQSGSIYEIFCFTTGTKVRTLRGQLDVSEVVEGDLILSHEGFSKVYATKTRDSHNLINIEMSDGSVFKCTPEHPFFTQRGWVEAQNLTKLDVCFKRCAWTSLLSTLISYYSIKNYLSGSTATKIEEYQTIGEKRAVEVDTYTSLFGKLITIKKYLRVLLYTIKTLIHSIMTFPILCVLAHQSIRAFTKSKSGKSVESTKKSAINVVNILLQGLLKRQFAFVQQNVQENMRKESVLSAVINILLAKIPPSVSVLSSAPIQESAKVYNFSVEKTHTFFANGILTHNCDEEMPLEFYDELMFRLTATSGIFTSGFTPTLNQLFWKQAMEGNKILPRALKMSVSMYECLKYEDGSPSRIMTMEKIREAEDKCKNETERQRRIYGKFVTESGRTYFGFEFDRNVVAPYDIKGWYIYAAVDYGSGADLEAVARGRQAKNHPAAIIFIAVRSDYRKGAVFKSWRGDNIKTTAGDVFNKYVELSKGMPIVQACYDSAAADFGTIADRNAVSFVKADKARGAGEDLVNTLFKHKMLDIFDDDPENLKLAGELSHIMITNQSGDAKKDDDLADANRYACMLIPWDLSVIKDLSPDELKDAEYKSRPMTEEEHQAMQIKMRRGEEIDGPKEQTEGWGELESEFDHWNNEYGQF